MVYKLGKNIFDDQECTVLEIGKEIPTVIPYTEIVRIMMIQDFKTNGIFIQIKLKEGRSLMVPIGDEEMDTARQICSFVQARIDGEEYTPPIRIVPQLDPIESVAEPVEIQRPLFKHKFSWLLLISFLLGFAYLIYSTVYWTKAAGTNLGGAIAVSVVYPHLICLFIAVILNFLSMMLRNTWIALAAAILYTIAIFTFPMYFMFVIIEAILCWVAFGLYVSKKR